MYRHQSTSSDYSSYSTRRASGDSSREPDLSFYTVPLPTPVAPASPRTRRSILQPILARQESPWSFPVLPSEGKLELCFCGKPADTGEDSIYCSVACGRMDAMSALCAQEEEFASEEEVEIARGGLAAAAGGEEMVRGGSAGSHYRRVEMAEAKKEAEKAVQEGREAIVGVWRYQKNKPATTAAAASPAPLPSPLLPSLPLQPQSYVPSHPLPKFQLPPFGPASTLPLRPLPRALTHAPCASTSTTNSAVPSFSSNGSSSSRHSYSSSLDSSIYDPTPISAQPFYTIPKISYDRYYEKMDQEISSLPESPFRFPASPGSDAHIEILDSFYMNSPTPTLVEKKKVGAAPGFVRAMFQDDENEEGRDLVARELPRRDRSQRRTHQKGKLSFDDVVNLMKA